MHLAARIPSIVLVAALASCGRAVQTGSPSPAASQAGPAQPLAAFMSQRLTVTPTGFVRGDSLGWVQRLGGARRAGRHFDSTVAAVLADRGIGRQWFLPPDLMRSYDRNKSYATNPYELAIEPLRPATFQALNRYGEPLASQLRTMIALHADARMVLLPVELKFERIGGTGMGVLRAVVLDARMAEARWVGEIRGDTSSAPARAMASVASRFADLFIAP